jgi:hypothetical protein
MLTDCSEECLEHALTKQKVRTCSKYSSFSQSVQAGNTKGGSITVPFTFCLTPWTREYWSVSQSERGREREKEGGEREKEGWGEREREKERERERERERCRIWLLHF